MHAGSPEVRPIPCYGPIFLAHAKRAQPKAVRASRMRERVEAEINRLRVRGQRCARTAREAENSKQRAALRAEGQRS